MVTRAEVILAGTDLTKSMFASASRNFDGLKNQISTVKAGATTLGTTIAGALALVGGKGVIDALDRLDDLQEKTGISVEKLSELRFAGESVGTPFEALAGGIGRLSKLMVEAAGGNKEASATFKALNIDIKNADGTMRSNEAVLGDLADRFVGYGDGVEKSALAQRVFGKSGAEMIPFLNQGREGIEKLRIEAEQLGAIYGGSLAKDAADLNDNMTKLRLASEAAAVAVGGPLLRSLVGITNQIIEAKKEGGLLNALLISIGGGFARTMRVDEIGKVQTRARDATGEMARLQGVMNGVELQLQRDPTNEMAQRRRDTIRSKIEEQQRIAAASSEELKRLANLADPMGDPQRRKEDRGFTPTSPDKGGAPVVPGGGGASKEKDQEAAAKRYIESLTKQTEKVKELSQVEISLAEIQRIRAAGGVVTEAEKQRILQISAEIDILKEREEADKAATKEREKDQQRLFALQDQAKQVYEASLTPLEAYNAAIARLNDLRRDGLISTETYARSISKEGQDFSDAEKRLRELANESDEFSKRAAENIQDSLGQGLVDILDGNFDDIGKNFVKMLRNMAAQALAANLSRAMFGDLVKGGEGNGLFGQLLRTVGSSLLGGGGGVISAANQASFDTVITGLAGARADGGPVAAGRAYLVGERGQEVFVPKSDGSIVPNHELGGSKSLTVNNLTNGRVDFASVDRTPSGDVLTLRQIDQIAAQFNDPNSRMSRGIGRTLAVQRKRG